MKGGEQTAGKICNHQVLRIKHFSSVVKRVQDRATSAEQRDVAWVCISRVMSESPACKLQAIQQMRIHFVCKGVWQVGVKTDTNEHKGNESADRGCCLGRRGQKSWGIPGCLGASKSPLRTFTQRHPSNNLFQKFCAHQLWCIVPSRNSHLGTIRPLSRLGPPSAVSASLPSAADIFAVCYCPFHGGSSPQHLPLA